MPGSAADVRLATEAELEAVTALLVAQLREHRVQTPEAKIASAIQGLLRRPERGRILVALEGGRPVGVAAFSFAWPLEYADRSAWLEELYVEPAARGRGIGTRLLRAALRVAAEAGATVVDLEVEADHQRAARLYAREGFRSLARTHWVRTLEPVDAPRAATPPAEITGGCFCGALRYRVSATTHDGRAVRHLGDVPRRRLRLHCRDAGGAARDAARRAPAVRRLRHGAHLPRNRAAGLGRSHRRQHGPPGRDRPRGAHLDREPARLAPPRRRPPAPRGTGPGRARRRAVRLLAPRRLRAARGAASASGAGVQLLDHPAQYGIHGGRLVRPARVDELLRVV